MTTEDTLKSKRVRYDDDGAQPIYNGSASFVSHCPNMRIPYVLERMESKLVGETYNLEDLTGVRKKYDEEAVKIYVERIATYNKDNTLKFYYKDEPMSGLKKMKYPVYASFIMKPDVFVILEIPKKDKKEKEEEEEEVDKVPVLQVQVARGKNDRAYSDSKEKLIMGLIEQFRLLSNYCEEGSDIRLTGFVFPSSKWKMWVSEVRLSWGKVDGMLGFKVFVKQLRSEEVADHINKAACSILEKNISIVGEENLFHLKLSEKHFKDVCSDGNQVRTRSSILLKNEDVYIKVYPEDVYDKIYKLMHIGMREILRKLGIDVPATDGNLLGDYLLIPETHHIKNAMKLKVLPYQPLSKGDAKLCLNDLVSKLCTALKIIHEQGIAHLDVRLPNICFNEKGHPIFIDPDRIERSTADASELSQQYDSKLYEEGKKSEGSWKMFNVDWRQLGYLILGVQDEDEDEVMDEFVKALIDTGTCI